MYGAVWRSLPGPAPVKAVLGLLLVVGVAALLWFFVFPVVEDRLPYNDVTVDESAALSAAAWRPRSAP